MKTLQRIPYLGNVSSILHSIEALRISGSGDWIDSIIALSSRVVIFTNKPGSGYRVGEAGLYVLDNSSSRHVATLVVRNSRDELDCILSPHLIRCSEEPL